jgi:hypothetical protein
MDMTPPFTTLQVLTFALPHDGDDFFIDPNDRAIISAQA